MSIKTLALATSFIGVGASALGEEIDTTIYTIGEEIAGTHIASMQADCYINTSTNENNTVIHCRNESSIKDFIASNSLGNIGYSSSLLKIQGESLIRILESVSKYPEKVGGILDLSPPYNFIAYPNRTRVCLEINHPEILNTLGGLFVDSDRDGKYEALITGECTGITEGENEFNIDQISLVYPGYSVTLPQTKFDCAQSGNIYNCRVGVDFPFSSLRQYVTRDIIQIQYPENTESESQRIDLSYTYVIEENSL